MGECACDFPRRKSVRSHKGDTGKPNLSEAGGIDSNTKATRCGCDDQTKRGHKTQGSDWFCRLDDGP